jgi:hypothetical protein
MLADNTSAFNCGPARPGHLDGPVTVQPCADHARRRRVERVQCDRLDLRRDWSSLKDYMHVSANGL